MTPAEAKKILEGTGLVVQIWDKGLDGKPDSMVSEKPLLEPAGMLEVYINSNCYLVVKETMETEEK